MTVWSDMRHAVRALVREPGFAALCVLMLALGIGANTAIFSIVNGVLLKELLYRDPAQLLSLREVIPAIASTYPTLPVSANHFTQWRQRCSSFESLSAMSTGTLSMTGLGEPERLSSARVSADFFDTLGTLPVLGRRFVAGEDGAGHDRVVILTDSLWRRRFDGDPSIIGKSVTLDGAAHTVVGVLPPSFHFPIPKFLNAGASPADKPEVFKPLVFSQDELKELSQARRKADLILSYGKQAVRALQVKGVGAETASRILGKMHPKEDEFYIDLLKAKILYLRTREFWDDKDKQR